MSLWFGALIMFIKADGFTIVTGAPPWLASPIWGYVPLVLVSIYVAIAIYRLLRPLVEPVKNAGKGNERSVASAPAPNNGSFAKAQNRPLIIRDMDSTRQSAGMSYNRNPREAEKEWPRMYAALLSANKEFGIPIPPIVNKAVMDLECGRRFLEQILPLLRAGHDEEARQAAATFNDRVTTKP